MKNCITCSFRSSEPEKYYKKYMKKMHMICKMEEKRVKYMCFVNNRQSISYIAENFSHFVSFYIYKINKTGVSLLY